MKKSLISSLCLGGCLLIVTGCGSATQPSMPVSQTHPSSIRLHDGRAIAYAYMKEGTRLVKISTSKEAPKEGVEIVKITEYGFYPDYTIPKKGSQGCIYSAVIDDKKRGGKYRYCHSFYTESTMSGKAFDLLGNALITIGTAGLNAATGTVSRVMEFNRQKFLEEVEKNDLPEYRDAIVQLRQLAQKRAMENNRIYDELYRRYTDYAKTIVVEQKTVDKSGLLPDGAKIEVDFTIIQDRPSRRRFGYDTTIEATPADFSKKIEAQKERILSKSAEDAKNYRIELDRELENYRFTTPKDINHSYNDHITFHVSVEAPEIISRTPEKPAKVTLTSIVRSADLIYMLPRHTQLKDSNIETDFVPSNTFGFVEAIAANKTKSFVTLKTLTIYYHNKVYTLANLNREIAPESVTLPGNSHYQLLPGNWRDVATFENMTLPKVERISIDYGYALKYRIEKTNLDRSIYRTDTYRLYDIYKSYM
ncbi:hypothetical protein [Hydrogenimonas sp.]